MTTRQRRTPKWQRGRKIETKNAPRSAVVIAPVDVDVDGVVIPPALGPTRRHGSIFFSYSLPPSPPHRKFKIPADRVFEDEFVDASIVLCRDVVMDSRGETIEETCSLATRETSTYVDGRYDILYYGGLL